MHTKTDWALVRDMMAAAIDTCERMEQLGLREDDRGLPAGADGATVFDVVTSAWTIPEHLRDAIVRLRHARGADRPYVLAPCRVLVGMAQACAEVVGAREVEGLEPFVRESLAWYPAHGLPLLEQALGRREP